MWRHGEVVDAKRRIDLREGYWMIAWTYMAGVSFPVWSRAYGRESVLASPHFGNDSSSCDMSIDFHWSGKRGRAARMECGWEDVDAC